MMTYRYLRRASRFVMAMALIVSAAVVVAIVHQSSGEAGSARYYGSAAALRLRQPIVDMAAKPNGNGYWMVASDGGVFTFGRAGFFGSTGNIRLHRPIVGMASTRSGRGYWLVASDGGVFTFGDARFWGSTGGRVLNAPMVGMASDPRSRGYWLVSRDGHVFSYGGARFLGSPGRRSSTHPVTGMAAAKKGGYWLATRDGGVYSATASGELIVDPNLRPRTREEAVAEDLFERINAERAVRGMRMLSWDTTLGRIATNHARYMGGTGNFAHQNLGALFGVPGVAGRYSALRENIYNGSGGYADSGSAHVSLMNSAPHRATILTPQLQSVGIGAACVNGRLWVTQDFGTFAGNPSPGAMGVPPRDPVARPSEGGPGC
jgi:uncharacterized protein YkwD